MSPGELEMYSIRKQDREQVKSFITRNWGSAISISRGSVHAVSKLPGFICKNDGQIVGLITYSIEEEQCEIVTLDSKIKRVGLGTRLIERVKDVARKNGCQRIWLITTNDNTNAIRFYQKRDFDWVGFYKDAMEVSRELKPEIPLLGNDQIQIKHEIEFEYKLDKI